MLPYKPSFTIISKKGGPTQRFAMACATFIDARGWMEVALLEVLLQVATGPEFKLKPEITRLESGEITSGVASTVLS